MPATMGCRTYVMKNINGEPGCKGRGNIAPVTINLPRIGIEAKGDIDKFFECLDLVDKYNNEIQREMTERNR